MSRKQRARPLAICLFLRQGRILVSQGVDLFRGVAAPPLCPDGLLAWIDRVNGS